MRLWVSLAFSIIFLFPTSIEASNQMDCKNLEKVFNTKVETKNNVCTISIARRNIKVTSMGKNLSSEMVDLSLNVNFELL